MIALRSVHPYLVLLIGMSLVFSCTGPKVATTADENPVELVETEVRNLDTLVVRPTEPLAPEMPQIDNDLPVYHASQPLEIDLIHTKLNLKFDWEKEAVLGKATLRFSPHFAPINSVHLDAKGFEIHHVTLLNTGRKVKYDYNDRELTVLLDRNYQRSEILELYIDYTAYPSDGEEGSSAITSDKGLFFINPRGEANGKPQQIWTQGETDFNSRWFPTVDQPNERCTQETLLTVQDRFTTLSNGELISQTSHPDGTRTDHWELKIPHAPYLFMVAVGEFAVVSDNWNGKKVDYYVEPEYEDDARAIFAHTPEMLTFFSNVLGMDYPWNKYSQVVVRDYVSGAMENTTAVIYGDFVQKHRRSLIDDGNDYIVAHELFHHWFGDYVTCESWSNLTLNEGFANYAEYLWFEHKYGLDRAADHRLQEIQGYLFQANQNVHPLIHFAYANKEDMFDQHSYNKGGLVLHMLRHHLGDEAFFAGLKKYLVDNALSAVEVDELRMAFEDIVGQDLNWFFNQWYLASGHPTLEMDYGWIDSSSTLSVQIEQTQDPTVSPAIFEIPTELEVYYRDGTRERIPVVLDQRKQELSFDLVEAPAVVVLDPDRIQLAIIKCQYNTEEYSHIYDYQAALELRLEALGSLGNHSDSASSSIVEAGLTDPFWSVRRLALRSLDWHQRKDLYDKLSDMAAYDRNSQVRAEAIYALGALGLDEYKDIIARGINMQDAYPVVGASIRMLNELDAALCEEKVASLMEDDHPEIVAAVSSIYGNSKDTSRLDYFAQHMQSVAGLPALDFYQSFERLLDELQTADQIMWLEKAKEVAMNNSSSPYTRIAATRMIISKLAQEKRDSSHGKTLKGYVEAILANERDKEVRSIYRQFLGS